MHAHFTRRNKTSVAEFAIHPLCAMENTPGPETRVWYRYTPLVGEKWPDNLKLVNIFYNAVSALPQLPLLLGVDNGI